MNEDTQDLVGMNTGVLIQEPKGSDFLAGGASAIVPEIRLETGDWSPYLPKDEMQIGVYFDTMACVTFSALNSIETQLNYMLAMGQIPATSVQKFRDLGVLVGNVFNFSDRFTAKMSGTTRQGNYLVNVWDSIRNHGLLAESDWAYPREQRQPVFDWDDYYKEIPQSLKDKALKIKDLIETKYEWLVAGGQAMPIQFSTWLKMAPIQLATAICPPWGAGEIVPECSLNVGHATELYKVAPDCYRIEDHYSPFQKRLSLAYEIPYALRGVVYIKSGIALDPALGKRLAGKILLNVEDRGAIWYITPRGTRARIGNKPEEVEAFLQMIRDKRVETLGINNADLLKIPTA